VPFQRIPFSTKRRSASSDCWNGANGGPAVAAYLPDHTATPAPYGLMALTVTNGVVATITGFPDPALFPIFGLVPAS